VTDLDGNAVEGVTEALFSHKAGCLPEIGLRLALCPVEIEGEAKLLDHNGKVVKTIIYEDGSKTDF